MNHLTSPSPSPRFLSAPSAPRAAVDLPGRLAKRTITIRAPYPGDHAVAPTPSVSPAPAPARRAQAAASVELSHVAAIVAFFCSRPPHAQAREGAGRLRV